MMKIFSAMAFASALLAPGFCLGAVSHLHVTKTITIDADAAKVWAVVKDFDGLNKWHPAVAKAEIVSGKNNEVNSVRLLTLKDGGTIKEKLLIYFPPERRFKYSILEGVLPVSNYTSTFNVTSAGKGKSTVTWSGNFMRKDMTEKPSEKENDKAATDTISAVYQAGLDNLKKIVEGK